jgi:hypothetical protein
VVPPHGGEEDVPTHTLPASCILQVPDNKEAKMARTVRVELGFTQNIGNFESIRVGVAYEDDLRDDQTHEEVRGELYDKVEQALVEVARDCHASLTGKAKRDTGINPGS